MSIVKKVTIVIVVILLLFSFFFYRTRLYKIEWKGEEYEKHQLEEVEKNEDSYNNELEELEEEGEEDDEAEDNEDNDSIESVTYHRETSSFTEKIPGQLTECIYKKDGVPSPKGIAFSLNGEEFWVTSLMNKSRGVIVFDSVTGSHKKDIILPNGGGVEVIFSKDGSSAYVSQMETGRVYEIDANLKKITRTFETNSSWTKVMALSDDESVLYASNWVGNNVSVIDLESGSLLHQIKTVTTPRGIYPTNNGQYLYVAGFKNGEIQKIDLETKKSIVLYRNEGAMRHIVADEEKGVLYFSDMANAKIYKVYMESDKVVEFVKTERNPNTITLTEDKKILIVLNRGVNNKESYHLPGPEWGTVMFFDTTTGDLLDVIIGGNQPTGNDVYKDRIVFSNFLDGNVVMCLMPSYKDFLDKKSHLLDDFRKYIIK